MSEKSPSDYNHPGYIIDPEDFRRQKYPDGVPLEYDPENDGDYWDAVTAKVVAESEGDEAVVTDEERRTGDD